jgi:hypothetical protein
MDLSRAGTTERSPQMETLDDQKRCTFSVQQERDGPPFLFLVLLRQVPLQFYQEKKEKLDHHHHHQYVEQRHNRRHRRRSYPSS